MQGVSPPLQSMNKEVGMSETPSGKGPPPYEKGWSGMAELPPSNEKREDPMWRVSNATATKIKRRLGVARPPQLKK